MKLSLTVRSTISATRTPRFWHYHTLDWLFTVPVTNMIDVKLTNKQNGLASFILLNKSQNDRSFNDHLSTFIKTQEIRLKERHLIV